VATLSYTTSGDMIPATHERVDPAEYCAPVGADRVRPAPDCRQHLCAPHRSVGPL